MASKEPVCVLTSMLLNDYSNDRDGTVVDGNFTLLCAGPVLLTAEGIQLLCPSWMLAKKVTMLVDGRFENATDFVPRGTYARIFHVTFTSRKLKPDVCLERIRGFVDELMDVLSNPVSVGTRLDARSH